MPAAGSWALWNVALAALLGAAGVALAAVAAHRVADPSLATAAVFLIVHAAGAVALSALASGARLPAGFLFSASLMIVAVALFSGDIAARVLVGERLFPLAAPIGGSLLMAAWILAALTAIAAAIRGGS